MTEICASRSLSLHPPRTVQKLSDQPQASAVELSQSQSVPSDDYCNRLSDADLSGAEMGYGALRTRDHATDEGHGDAAGSQSTMRDDLLQHHANEAWQEYIANNPLLSAYIPSPSLTIAGDLLDPPGNQSIALSVCMASIIGKGVRERWDVDRESATLLASVLAFSRSNDIWTTTCQDTLRFRDLRLNEPVLKCDPEVDLRRVKHRNDVSIFARTMEQFLRDEGQDESFDWPPVDVHLLSAKEKLAVTEKLEVGKDVMEYLLDVAEPTLISENEWIAELSVPKKVKGMRPLTPPLMPLSPSFSTSTMPPQLPKPDLTSSPEDLMAVEAAELERHLTAVDQQISEVRGIASLAKNADTDSVFSSLRTPEDSSSSPLRRKRLEDLKAETPLMPHESHPPPLEHVKAIRFPSELHTLVPSPESEVSIMNPQGAGRDLHHFVEEYAKPLAVSAIRRTEEEKLSEFDTTMRIAVPAIDAIEMLPPWRSLSSSSGEDAELMAQRSLLSITNKELIKNESPWTGISKLERSLPWRPFPARLGQVKLDEAFDDGSAARYMAELSLEDTIDLDSWISKAEGLRLLEVQDGDDDDLDYADTENAANLRQSPQPVVPTPEQRTVTSGTQKNATTHPQTGATSTMLNMQTLLRKRKLELEQESKQTHVHPQKVPRRSEVESQGLPDLAPTSFGDLCKVSNLTSFMHIQGSKSNQQHDQHPPQEALRGVAAPSATLVPALPQTERNIEVVQTQSLQSHGTSFPVPKVVCSHNTMQIVVSARMLAERQLTRKLQSMLPTVDFIERDTILGNTHPEKASKVTGDVEADMILSPRTGLLITTMQKLKQRPLPGQSSFFGIQERITLVSLRHEQLVVLVGDGQRALEEGGRYAQPLDERDCEALSDVMRLASVLETDVQIRYVPGGEDELVKWMAAVISHHAGSDKVFSLLEAETLWERFLRVAGMNAFASQCVLSGLKPPEDPLDCQSSSTLRTTCPGRYGLAAFVRMSPEQRIAQFSPLLGGDRVIRRVSEVIDKQWLPAYGAGQ